MSDPNATNVTSFDFTPSPPKVMKFREDYRLSVINGIRSLALCGLLAVCMLSAFSFASAMILFEV